MRTSFAAGYEGDATMTRKDCPGHTAGRRRRISSASKCFAISALALTCGLIANAPSSQAAEYGFTTYPLGSLAFGAGATPPPGTYVTDSISYFSGPIGGNIDLGGLVFNSGAKAEIFLEVSIFLVVPQENSWTAIWACRSRFPSPYVI